MWSLRGALPPSKISLPSFEGADDKRESKRDEAQSWWGV